MFFESACCYREVLRVDRPLLMIVYKERILRSQCDSDCMHACMHAAGPCMGKSQACRRTIMRNDLGADFPGAILIFLAQQSPTHYYHTMSQ